MNKTAAVAIFLTISAISVDSMAAETAIGLSGFAPDIVYLPTTATFTGAAAGSGTNAVISSFIDAATHKPNVAPVIITFGTAAAGATIPGSTNVKVKSANGSLTLGGVPLASVPSHAGYNTAVGYNITAAVTGALPSDFAPAPAPVEATTAVTFTNVGATGSSNITGPLVLTVTPETTPNQVYPGNYSDTLTVSIIAGL